MKRLTEGMPAHVTIDYKVLPSRKRTDAPYPRRARMRGYRPSERGRAHVLRLAGKDD